MNRFQTKFSHLQIADASGESRPGKNPFTSRKTSPRSLKKEDDQQPSWKQCFSGRRKNSSDSKSSTSSIFKGHGTKNSGERQQSKPFYQTRWREHQPNQEIKYGADKENKSPWLEKSTTRSAFGSHKSPFDDSKDRSENRGFRFGQKTLHNSKEGIVGATRWGLSGQEERNTNKKRPFNEPVTRNMFGLRTGKDSSQKYQYNKKIIEEEEHSESLYERAGHSSLVKEKRESAFWNQRRNSAGSRENSNSREPALSRSSSAKKFSERESSETRRSSGEEDFRNIFQKRDSKDEPQGFKKWNTHKDNQQPERSFSFGGSGWQTGYNSNRFGSNQPTEVERLKEQIKDYEENPEKLVKQKEQKEKEKQEEQQREAFVEQICQIVHPEWGELESQVTQAHIEILTDSLKDEQDDTIDQPLLQLVRDIPSIQKIASLPENVKNEVLSIPIQKLSKLGPLLEITSLDDVQRYLVSTNFEIMDGPDHLDKLNQEIEDKVNVKNQELCEAANELIDELANEVKFGLLEDVVSVAGRQAILSNDLEDLFEAHLTEQFDPILKLLEQLEE